MSILAGITNFDKSNLSKTTTVVRKNVFINLEAKEKHGLGDKEDFTEHFDSFKDLQRKAKLLAKKLKKSKYAVAYTGAGISTSANLDDYRGPKGMWTLASQGLTSVAALESNIEDCKPTMCHYVLLQLQKAGYIKKLISTNTDGLHVRSGFPRSHLAELHGNAYKEICETCGAQYMRDFDTTTNVKRPEHWTGRICDKKDCDGRLYDTIVGFGEGLPKDEYANCRHWSRKSDMSLVLGTSMKVQPAASLPTYAIENGGSMVICNLQQTDYDDQADFAVNAYTDDLLFLVSKELGVTLDKSQESNMAHFDSEVSSRYQ